MNVTRMAAAALAAAVLTGAVLTGAAACGGQKAASVAANGYGSGATVMIHSQFREGTPDSLGARLCRRLIAMRGVVFTNYTRQGGLTVGLSARAATSSVERVLRAQPAVLSVSERLAPTAAPTPTARGSAS